MVVLCGFIRVINNEQYKIMLTEVCRTMNLSFLIAILNKRLTSNNNSCYVILL